MLLWSLEALVPICGKALIDKDTSRPLAEAKRSLTRLPVYMCAWEAQERRLFVFMATTTFTILSVFCRWCLQAGLLCGGSSPKALMEALCSYEVTEAL